MYIFEYTIEIGPSNQRIDSASDPLKVRLRTFLVRCNTCPAANHRSTSVSVLNGMTLECRELQSLEGDSSVDESLMNDACFSTYLSHDDDLSTFRITQFYNHPDILLFPRHTNCKLEISIVLS